MIQSIATTDYKYRFIISRLWPQIEFFSSGGQESRCLRVIQQQPFILGACLGSFRTR